MKLLYALIIFFLIIVKPAISKETKAAIKIYSNEYIFNGNNIKKELIKPFPTDNVNRICPNKGDSSTKIQTSVVETTEKYSYLIENSEMKFSGINDVSIKNNNLIISLNQFQGYDFYESLTNKHIAKTTYGGDLFTGVAVNIMTLGIPLILAPKKNVDLTFGCSDEITTNREIDRTRSEQKLEVTVWRKVSFPESFKIIGPNFEFNSEDIDDGKFIAQNNSSVTINLNEKLKSNLNYVEGSIKIVCTTCNAMSPSHQLVLGPIKTDLLVTANLRYIKSDIEIAEDLRLEKIKQEFNNIIATKEGAFCAVKENSTTLNDKFNKCYEDEITKSALQKKFLDAVATQEGGICSKRFKINNNNFWNCYDKTVTEFKAVKAAEELRVIELKKFSDAIALNEGSLCFKKYKVNNSNFWDCFNKNLAESNIKKKQQEDKEQEEQQKKTEYANLLKRDDIARQCIEIGFEFSTAPYKDCYLKLKLHTEQIIEWRKLQSAMQNQRNQSSSNQASNVRSANSVSPDVNYDQSEALLGIAQRSLETAFGQNRPVQRPLTLPPPPMQIITPRGNSYNCSMMGAAMRCR